MNSNVGAFKRSKNVILAILEGLNFGFSKFEQLSSPKCTKTKIQNIKNCQKIILLNRLNSPKFAFMQNLSGGKMIKFQQNQVLTSHFESFCSILHYGNLWILLQLTFYVKTA